MKITAVRFECFNEEGERTERLVVLPGYHSTGFGEYFRWAHPMCKYIMGHPHLINTEEDVGSNNFMEIFNRWKNCTSCPLGKRAHKKAFYRGDLESPYVFIGEAPGAEENKYGMPFVGRAGVLLDTIIKSMGLDPEFVLIVNPILCQPTDEEGKNRKPTAEEASVCVSHLNQILGLAKRKAYYLLGDTAKRTFGITLPLNSPTTFGAVVYHPAFFLREGVPDKPSGRYDRAIEILKRAVKVRAKALPKADGLALEAIKHSRWHEWEKVCGGTNA